MNRQLPNPVWQMLNHEYHERLNTHGMVLDSRAVIEHHNTMISTMKKIACTCLPVPAEMPDANKISLAVKTTYM